MADENKQPLEESELEGVAGGGLMEVLNSITRAASSNLKATFRCAGCGADYSMNIVENTGFKTVLGENYCPNCLRAKGVL